jgi:predicted transposase YdaD
VDDSLAKARARLLKEKHKGDRQARPAEKQGRTSAHKGERPTAAALPLPGLTRRGRVGHTSSAPQTAEPVLTPEAKRRLLNLSAFFASIRAENEAPSAVPRLLETLNLESDNRIVVVPLERGRKRGRAEGEAEGALEQARAGLLKVLKCRFGQTFSR